MRANIPSTPRRGQLTRRPSPLRAVAVVLLVAANVASHTTAAAVPELRMAPDEARFSTARTRERFLTQIGAIETGLVAIDERTTALAAKLDSPDYHEREAVAVELEADSVELSQLYALLQGATLNAEQRYRLLDIIRHRLLFAPRGAVGIQMQQRIGAGAQPPGLEVLVVLDGLPAKGVLQPGDRITHVDGFPMLEQRDLITRVQSKKPGDHVELAVLRPRTNEPAEEGRQRVPRTYESLHIDLALGSADKLDEFNGIQPSNPVLNERRTQAMLVASSFAPRPRLIPVPPSGAEVSSPRQPLSLPIDDHPIIQTMLAHRMQIARDPKRYGPQYIPVWPTMLDLLREEASSPWRSEQERAELQVLAERFAALMALPIEAPAPQPPSPLPEQPK